MARTEKRGIVWQEMRRLEGLGLGTPEKVSELRDRFVLAPGHPAASKLISKSGKGFIRADEGSLLFRNASQAFQSSISSGLRAKAMQSEKGLEFRWTQLSNEEILALLDAVGTFAGQLTPGEFAAAGSQRWLQVIVERRPDLLRGALASALKLGSGADVEWISPRRRTGFKEFRDMEALRQLGIRELPRRALGDFWPQRGPVWDALGKTTEGQLLFVEAKAHIAEAASPGTKAGDDSLAMIEAACAEARRHYAPRAKADWTGTFYQYANRLAHHYLLRHVNRMPSHLVFVYFCGAGDAGVAASAAEWRGAVQLLHAALGLPPHGEDPYVHEVFIDVEPLVRAASEGP